MSSRSRPHSPDNLFQSSTVSYSRHTIQLSVFILCLSVIAAVLLPSCTKRQPLPAVQDLHRPTYTEDEVRDISLTVLLLNPGRIRALMSSEDPLAWIAEYWERNDPSPDTPENEALEVLRQRARYLNDLFPGLPLNEIPEPWESFLRNGHWDWIQSGILPFTLRYIDDARSTPVRTAYRDSILFATDILLYNSPEPFMVAIYENDVIGGPEDPKIASLRRAWETLENPRSSRSRKGSALRRITWYEIPSFARRLLDIPDSSLADLGDALDEHFRRMALRRAYCLGTDGARRLAAITAAGASPRLQLTRAAGEEYATEQYLSDLRKLLEDRRDSDPPRSERPHPSLLRQPEGFLVELAERFPTTESVTGWDWTGDLYLAFGPPLFFFAERRTAYYTHRYPVTLGIRSGVLGAVDRVILEDVIQEYIENNYRDIWGRRAQARTIVEDLKSIIPEASRATESLLDQLNKLLPPESRTVGLQHAYNAFDITADLIAFQEPAGSVDVLASVGVPFNEIRLSGTEPLLWTNLETSCLLLRSTLYPVWDELHDGFPVERPRGSSEYLYLVDTFRYKAEPGSYILYCSALDPDTEKSGGVIIPLDVRSEDEPGLRISQIALAGIVDDIEQRGAFIRGAHGIVPYPGRNLLYGEDIWLYFEISGLERSDVGDYAWEESYYIIPDRKDLGVVRIVPGLTHSALQPDVERSFMVDLSVMEKEYAGPFFVVVLVTDIEAGQNALSVARFNIYSR